MNNCAHCQSETNNPKFCSKSCAAKLNNVLFPKREKQLKIVKEKQRVKKPKQDKKVRRKRSIDEIKEAVLKSKSYSGVIRLLGLKPAGGNYSTILRYIEEYDIDTSHMTHQSSNKGKIFKSFDGLTSNDAIKKRLVAERGYCCEGCSLDTWLGLPITLELEHVDGNNRNGDRSNLKLLCPNCHAQTPTWRNRKR